MRRSPYRLVLPEGPLRRFRLPESLGDEAPKTRDAQPIPVLAGLGWAGVCLGVWGLAHGAWDPTAWLNRSWEMPSDQHSSPSLLVAHALGPTSVGSAPRSLPSARGPQAPSPQRAASASVEPGQLAQKRWTDLPPVAFPEPSVHSGGWGAPRPAFGAGAPEALSDSDLTLQGEQDLGQGVQGDRLSAATARTSPTPSLGEMVRDLVKGTGSGLPPAKSPAFDDDPFQADFGSATLPSLATEEPIAAPVGVRPLDVRAMPRPGDGAPEAVGPAPSSERGSASWNGGCQRAFDASVQKIEAARQAKDASKGDYSQVLSRLDVAGCHPRARTQIEVCVAVDGGHAVGVTVHTTPSTPALAACLTGRVRALSFPASGGTDLVRTQFRVE